MKNSSIAIPKYWTSDQAVAVYHFLDTVLLEIQQCYRDELEEAYGDPYTQYPDPEDYPLSLGSDIPIEDGEDPF